MEGDEHCAAGFRVVIDTSSPFGSVKEAVALFGERVLAGGVYASRLTEVQGVVASRVEHAVVPPRRSSTGFSLEEARKQKLEQELEREREEKLKMARCINTLKEELQKAKEELHQLKEKAPTMTEKSTIDLQIEDLKFVENDLVIDMPSVGGSQGVDFQKKRYVTFADTPSVFHAVEYAECIPRAYGRQPTVPNDVTSTEQRKKKKKTLVPLISAFFIKKKVCTSF